MKSLENIKEKLQRGIDKLPEHKIPEVLQFVNFLLYSQQQVFCQSQEDIQTEEKREVLRERDPLDNFIGAVECRSLAQNIDV